MHVYSIAVIGGDLRQCYLAEYLYQMGQQVACFRTVPFSFSSDKITVSSDPEIMETADVIAGPMPFSRQAGFVYTETPDSIAYRQLFSHLHAGQLLAAGCPDAAALAHCAEAGVRTFDLLSSERLARANAALTAEGITAQIIRQTPAALSQSPALIIGFGRCGSMSARALSALGCPVSICEISPLRRAEAAALGYRVFSPSGLPDSPDAFSILLNTVPAPVLTGPYYERLAAQTGPHKTVLFDLAGAPGGIDLANCQALGIPAHACPGLPGKTAPASAGQAMGRALLDFLYHI